MAWKLIAALCELLILAAAAAKKKGESVPKKETAENGKRGLLG